METTKNSTADNQNMPLLCLNGCGFFGNPTFENYCSQCYRARESTNLMDATAKPQGADQPLLVSTKVIEAATSRNLTPIESSTPTLSPALPLSPDSPRTPSDVSAKLTPQNPSVQLEKTESNSSTPEEKEPEAPRRLVQNSKSKCFLCRAKIPLAKQITNQCRCEYVFCTTHKHPDQHDCDYEYKSEGRSVLAKNNLKLNENKGGRSFNRII